MSNRHFCEELLEVVNVIETGFRAPLENISDKDLNHVFADHKMTIGQIAVHCTAWAQYFLAPKNEKPWEVVSWTCRPCEYPLTLAFVNSVVDDGFNAIRQKLRTIDDTFLEETSDGEKGPGYIITRLQLHALHHVSQMSYLRQLLEPEWGFGTHFGDMASALINLSYHTTRDLSIRAF